MIWILCIDSEGKSSEECFKKLPYQYLPPDQNITNHIQTTIIRLHSIPMWQICSGVLEVIFIFRHHSFLVQARIVSGLVQARIVSGYHMLLNYLLVSGLDNVEEIHS